MQLRRNQGIAHDLLAIVLAGGVGQRLIPLTRHRSKPAVPFGRDGFHGEFHGRFHGRGDCDGATGANDEALAEALGITRLVQRTRHLGGPLVDL